MQRLIGPSAKRLWRNSWFILPGLIFLLLSLFVSIFSDVGSGVHAASRPKLTNVSETRFIHNHANGYHAKVFIPLGERIANISDKGLKKRPDLMLTRTNLPDTTFHGKKQIEYILAVSNGRSAGSIVAGNAITISNPIPSGITGLTTRTNNSDWKVKLSSKKGSTNLTATYVGAYPVLAGDTLAPIMVQGFVKNSISHQKLLPSIVRILHSNNSKKSGLQTLLQQNSAHDFTVLGGTTPKITKAGESVSGVTASDVAAINNVTPTPTNTPTPTATPSGTYQVPQTVVYTLAVSNSGSGGPVLSGDSIVVTDPIPAGLSNISIGVTSTDWSYTLTSTTSPATLTATYIGAYPVAVSAALSSITVTGTLTSTAVPLLTNTAVVVTPNDSNNNNNSSTNAINITSAPDLTVTDPQPSGTFEVGKPVTYTVTGSNVAGSGPVPVGDAITITDTVPAGVTSVTASGTNWTFVISPASGPSPTTVTATYTGTLPLAGGTTLSAITITGTLNSSAVSSLVNTAVISTPKDTNSANNTATNTITVVPQPDLALAKTIPAAGSLQVGHSVTYALVVTNGSSAGPVLSGDTITIADTIPAGFTNLTSSGTNWTTTLVATTSPTTLNATYTGTFPVAANATLPTISLTGTLTSTAYPSVTNSATVTTQNDGNTANNTATLTTSVLKQPDLSLTKTVALAAGSLVREQAQPSAPVQGKRFRSAIGVKNADQAGPVLADDPITVFDQLPPRATELVTSTNHKYWHTRLQTTKNGTTMIATYVGPHPVLAGTSLPLIIIDGVTTERSTAKFANAVVVTKTQQSNGSNRTNSKASSTTKRAELSLGGSGTLTPTFQGGQQVTYRLIVSNSSKAGPVIPGDPIVMVDKIPGGLTNLKASANPAVWSTKLNAITSPTTLTATYVGSYPIAAGARLPAIMLNGTLTGAVSQLTNTALVRTPDDTGTTKTNKHTGTTTIKVIPAPDLAITKTNFGGHTFYPGQQVQYVLHIHSTEVSGTILASVPVRVIDVLPNSAYHVKAYGKGWDIRIRQSAHGTLVLATYAGHYPVLANTSLPSIIVDSRVRGRDGSKIVNTAQVVIPYDSHLGNNVARDTVMIHSPALPPTGSDPNA